MCRDVDTPSSAQGTGTSAGVNPTQPSPQRRVLRATRFRNSPSRPADDSTTSGGPPPAKVQAIQSQSDDQALGGSQNLQQVGCHVFLSIKV